MPSRQNMNVMVALMISVSSLPTDHVSSFFGAEALPSLSGQGAYLQHEMFFYELSCDSTSCNWSILTQQLGQPVIGARIMYLPPGFGRENCSPLSDGRREVSNLRFLPTELY